MKYLVHIGHTRFEAFVHLLLQADHGLIGQISCTSKSIRRSWVLAPGGGPLKSSGKAIFEIILITNSQCKAPSRRPRLLDFYGTMVRFAGKRTKPGVKNHSLRILSQELIENSPCVEVLGFGTKHIVNDDHDTKASQAGCQIDGERMMDERLHNA